MCRHADHSGQKGFAFVFILVNCLLALSRRLYQLCKIPTVASYTAENSSCLFCFQGGKLWDTACLLLCWYSKWHITCHSSVQLYVLRSCTQTHVHVQQQQKTYTVVDLSGHPVVSSVFMKGQHSYLPRKSFNTPKAAYQELNNLPHTQPWLTNTFKQ